MHKLLAITLGCVLSAGPLAETLNIGGTGGALGTMRMLGKAFHSAHPGVEVVIHPSLGSNGGIKALVAGAIDIAVSARALTASERAQGLQAIEYGRTPFVLATAQTNPVDSVTLAEVAAIYLGERRTWPDGTRIRVVLRPAGDSDTLTLGSLSAELERAIAVAQTRPGLPLAVTDQENADALEKTPGALGGSTLAQIVSERRALKALSIDGVTPSPEALANGRYPYYRGYFLVIGAQPSATARAFVDFTSSPTARQLLARIGYWVRDAHPAP